MSNENSDPEENAERKRSISETSTGTFIATSVNH